MQIIYLIGANKDNKFDFVFYDHNVYVKYVPG